MTTKSWSREGGRSGRLSPRRSLSRPGLVAAIRPTRLGSAPDVLGSAAVKRDWGRIALYAGGFLGPFGGGVVTVLVPDLRHELHTSTAGAAAALTVYLIPFALLQFFSGTIGERRGLARTVRGAYVVYAIASVGVAMTSSLVPFLAL